jgi:glycosyltransferase involved in cell wall biosynthesis
MTCYNHAQYLKNAIDSVLKQTLLPSEILISNDCSIDETKNILDDYAATYPDLIKVYHQESQLGCTKNKNFVLSKCKEDYITWLDGDDILHPNKLEWEMNELLKFPDAKVVFSDVDKIDGDGKFLTPMLRADMMASHTGVPALINMKAYQTRLYPHILKVESPIAHHRNEIVHRDVINKIGLFDEKLLLWQDYDYRVRIHESFNCVYVPCTLQYYRIHDSQTSSVEDVKYLQDVKYLYDKLDIKHKSKEIQDNWK